MSIEVYLNSKDKSYDAKGTYSEGIFVVKKGSKIRLDFAEHIRGGRKAMLFRNDPIFVDEAGNVLADCTFSSPSTAAQFVTGRSTNGHVAWHIDQKTTLKKYISELEGN